jgi:hypothetical protein
MSEYDDHVATHLMPGKMIVYQDNSNQTFKLASEIFASGSIDLIANPNPNGHATGKGFFDDGESQSKLDSRQYEYYEFRLNGKTLTKWNLNEDFKPENTTKLYTMMKLIITNANRADYNLSGTDFACAMHNDGKIDPLEFMFNETAGTLFISSKAGDDI